MGPKLLRIASNDGSSPAALSLPVIYSPVDSGVHKEGFDEERDDSDQDVDDDCSMNNDHAFYDLYDDDYDDTAVGCEARVSSKAVGGAASALARKDARKQAKLRKRLDDIGQQIRSIQSRREQLRVKLPSAQKGNKSKKKSSKDSKDNSYNCNGFGLGLGSNGGALDDGSVGSSVVGSTLTVRSKSTKSLGKYSTASSRKYGGLFHPQIEFVFGQIINSPYLTSPIDAYPEKTIRMHDTIEQIRSRVVEMQIASRIRSDREARLAAKTFNRRALSTHNHKATPYGAVGPDPNLDPRGDEASMGEWSAEGSIADLLPYELPWAHERFMAVRNFNPSWANSPSSGSKRRGKKALPKITARCANEGAGYQGSEDRLETSIDAMGFGMFGLFATGGLGLAKGAASVGSDLQRANKRVKISSPLGGLGRAQRDDEGGGLCAGSAAVDIFPYAAFDGTSAGSGRGTSEEWECPDEWERLYDSANYSSYECADGGEGYRLHDIPIVTSYDDETFEEEDDETYALGRGPPISSDQDIAAEDALEMLSRAAITPASRRATSASPASSSSQRGLSYEDQKAQEMGAQMVSPVLEQERAEVAGSLRWALELLESDALAHCEVSPPVSPLDEEREKKRERRRLYNESYMCEVMARTGDWVAAGGAVASTGLETQSVALLVESAGDSAEASSSAVETAAAAGEGDDGSIYKWLAAGLAEDFVSAAVSRASLQGPRSPNMIVDM